MNPLAPIFDAYQTARDAMKVVSRCTTLRDIDEDRPFRNTRFSKQPNSVNLDLLKAAEGELDDLAVLSLYATFENRLREHVAEQGQLLHSAVGPEGFGTALRARYEEWTTESLRMDHAVKFFETTVDKELIAQVGQVRTYRHWIAHGRGPNAAPPGIHPRMAYDILTEFLVKSQLVQED